MRGFVFLILVALPLAAFANSTNTDFVAVGSGTLGGIGTGTLFDTSSTISLAMGFNGNTFGGPNLGTLSFSTGAILNNSNGISTFASGGYFTITGNGTGLPGGTLFTGTFTGKATLVTVELANGTSYGTLLCEVADGCSITGHWANGERATGSMVVVEQGGSIEFAYVNLQSQQTGLVPEPGTLSLLGTGLLGLGVVVRRKLKV